MNTLRNVFWHLPVFLMLIIYLPAAIFGIYIFQDTYSIAFLVSLGIFVACYYGFFSRFLRWFHRYESLQAILWRLGDNFNWRIMALLATLTYLASIIIASFTVELTPIGTALRGGDLLDIASARAEFLANREGVAALLRYSAVILGRSVMPFLIVYAYWSGNRFRHLMLLGLLLCYVISLEKASPIFLFLPLILLGIYKKSWRAVIVKSTCLIFCIGIWTFLAMGGLYDSQRKINSSIQFPISQSNERNVLDQPPISRDENSADRLYLIFYRIMGVKPEDINEKQAIGKLIIISNRIFWIPYMTAYDWLKFHDKILDGKLTYGRSIGFVSWLLDEPKLELERMVYEYEFGPPPAGAGASNTVFFVDAKLAFGWLGVIIYCILFTACAVSVLSSSNEAAKIASVTSFFTACLSPLTATLLSGGLFFYMLVCLLVRPVPEKRAT